MRIRDFWIVLVILAVVLLFIFPLSATLMDVLLILNLTLSLLVLMLSLYIKEPLEFSVFPTMLLFITLFRLSLNISSSKLILGNQGQAGSVIHTFGSFVIGSNLVVGLIVFFIIMVVQFIVITKGAERVAEVSARFTLDAMPGKQMAIDADLNTGAIDEVTAKTRRLAIQKEADFHGAMDGAAKFIKGDAIAAIIITLINIVGGLIIGWATMGKSPLQVVQIFTLATVGDGLVQQLPALMVSTASGIVVTRSGNNQTFGAEAAGQIFGQPTVMILTGLLILGLSAVPGLPKPILLLIAAILLAVGFIGRNRA
ncbi:MAG: flagellar biosynthesis protein FlhA, partial [Clostridiales bacterium]|nr:flagellar biosynthesis protein FlhA [Clostridiales bacterium]